MVDIAPFRALRFSDQKKDNRDISRFICPPYDVISAAERESLVKKSPANVVQLELPVANGTSDRYAAAAAHLRTWKAQGQLQEDRISSFYLLETTFKIKDPFAPSKSLKRYGVMTALRLETPGKGSVHPHEKTLPKAKEDRMNLITALQVNVSPVFGLFFDTGKKWKSWVAKASKQKPLVVGKEHKDLSHRVWKIDSPVLQKELRALMKTKDLYIADGHHRYEVSWAYRESRLGSEPEAGMKAGWRRVMAYICPMEESGLLMLPTHRLIKTSHSLSDWKRHLQNVFEIRPAKNIAALVSALSKPRKERTIGWVNSEGCSLLVLKKHLSVDRCLEHRPEAMRELDVVLLHDLAFGECANPAFTQNRELVYTRDMKEIQDRIKSDSSWSAFILGSPGVASLARVASANEVMPPKTTYFYPKVPTGFTLMPLEQEIA